MDNKYLNGKIYKITSTQTDKVYIGSTIKSLKHRLDQHQRQGENNSIRSKEILKYDNISIILIEDYPCNSKKELETRERYYIENTPNTINKCIPTRTKKEWAENYKQQQKLNSKKYQEKYPERVKLTRKNYKQTNKDKLKAIRDYQNTWCGNHRHNNHNNLLYISLDIFK